MGARFVLRDEADYPPALRHINDAPPGLYLWGPGKLPTATLAIIGTRHASVYGRRIARTWAQRLASAGIGIVSGLALGIDAEAHAGALDASGMTAAVLGGGLDIVYPPENAALRERIIGHGLLISEFHLGRRVDRQSFPQRNRLVSGMCDAVLVIESGAPGGSMITARFAAEQGRTVMAVPGRIDERQTVGCHQLIRDGAILVTSVEDVLEELRSSPSQLGLSFASPDAQAATPDAQNAAAAPPERLTTEEAAFYETLKRLGPSLPDAMAAALHQPIATVQVTAMQLELKGVIARQTDGRWDRLG